MNTSVTNNIIIISDLESETFYHAEVLSLRESHMCMHTEMHALKHSNAHTGFYPKLASTFFRAFKFPSEEP